MVRYTMHKETIIVQRNNRKNRLTYLKHLKAFLKKHVNI